MDQTALLDFGDIQTRDKLDFYVQRNVQQDDGDPVRGLTFLAENVSPESVFREYNLDSFSVDVEKKEEFTQLNVSRRRESDSYEDGHRVWEGTVYLIAHQQEDVYTAFSISDREFYEKCVQGYIKSLPWLSTTYLTTTELRGVFDVLDDQISGDIIVEEAVIKSPSKKTDILYLKEKYYELFNTEKVSEGAYYVDKVKFSIEGRTTFSGFISRNGHSRYSKGSSGVYFDYLLDITSEALVEKGSIFEGKDRQYGTREANRLEIDFEPGTIRGREANFELIDALRDMSSSSLTVYHKNPYMHASVLDFGDGTTADIFITSDRKVSIIPGFEASKGSLSRICDRITSHFREGEVSEGTSENREFDDFFSG